jgi:hypothetical protein
LYAKSFGLGISALVRYAEATLNFYLVSVREFGFGKVENTAIFLAVP